MPRPPFFRRPLHAWIDETPLWRRGGSGWGFLFFSAKKDPTCAGVRVCGDNHVCSAPPTSSRWPRTRCSGSWVHGRPFTEHPPHPCCMLDPPFMIISALGFCTDNPYDGQGTVCFEPQAQANEAACVATGRLCQWNEAPAGECDEIAGCLEGLSQSKHGFGSFLMGPTWRTLRLLLWCRHGGCDCWSPIAMRFSSHERCKRTMYST